MFKLNKKCTMVFYTLINVNDFINSKEKEQIVNYLNI